MESGRSLFIKARGDSARSQRCVNGTGISIDYSQVTAYCVVRLGPSLLPFDFGCRPIAAPLEPS